MKHKCPNCGCEFAETILSETHDAQPSEPIKRNSATIYCKCGVVHHVESAASNLNTQASATKALYQWNEVQP